MHVNVRRVGVGRVGVCMLCVCDSDLLVRGLGPRRVAYYESLKRELKTKPIKECRCDERLQTRVEESTRLACPPRVCSGKNRDEEKKNSATRQAEQVRR